MDDMKKTPKNFLANDANSFFRATDGVSMEIAPSTDEIVSLEESGDVEKQNLDQHKLVSWIEDRFMRAKDRRRTDELRWLECYRNFRGLYDENVVNTSPNQKSQAFIKITKTKVLAAFSQIMEVLFAGGKFPIGVEATPVPEGIEEAVHVEQDPNKKGPPAQKPTGNPAIARPEIMERLGSYKELLEPLGDAVQPGYGTTDTAITFEPAKDNAKKLERLIHDQLIESNADISIRRTIFEMPLFGHGIFKGPFAKDKEYGKWDKGENGKGIYNPIIKTIPDCSHVSIWNAYPDPDARSIDECQDFIERHRMNKSQLRALKRRPHFRSESIDLAIEADYNYTAEYWEAALSDYRNEDKIERFEVLEYWGVVDSDFEEFQNTDFLKDFKDLMKDADQVQINAWVCNGHLLRLVLNPFTPARLPYHAVPYELNPYSFFGVGVAENMTDTQAAMNGFFRMAVDNAALSSNVIFEINEALLSSGQTFELYPGKIFKTDNIGNNQKAIQVNKIDNVTQETLMMFDKARQLADEATGIPSYSHGQGGIQGIGRTAAGMSMLMGAAAQNIKTVVKNIDDYLLVPLGKSLFMFNMQFNFDEDFVGDLDIVARGTESLIRNEVRSQKLLQLLAQTANPMDAPFIKRDVILRELAESLDLKSELIVNDLREASVRAMQMKELMMAQGIDPNSGGGQDMSGGGEATPSVSDPTGTGGGNIAPGAAPTPGEQGHTGSTPVPKPQ
jgi:hypothetical protein